MILLITRLIQIRSFMMMFFALIIMLRDTCFRFLRETTFQFICIICVMLLVLCFGLFQHVPDLKSKGGASKGGAPKAAGVSHHSPRAQTCTFEGPGLQNHHQNSTRRPPRDGHKEKKEKYGAGEEKKEQHFGRSGGGRSGEVRVRADFFSPIVCKRCEL